MGFLKRSKSEGVRPVDAKPLPMPPSQASDSLPRNVQFVDDEAAAKKDRRRSRFERRRSIFGRAKSADPARRSILPTRPHTADRVIVEEEPDHASAALGQGPVLPNSAQNASALFGEKISFQTGDATFDFPTPSPRLPPPRRSATYQVSSSNLAAGPGSLAPAIGLALGSPSQPPPGWTRTHTTDTPETMSTLHNRPAIAPRAMTQPVTALPEYDDTVVMPELRRKKSGWKALGSLFSSRKSKAEVAPEPFYKVQISQPPPRPSEQTPRRTEAWERDDGKLQATQYAKVPTNVARPLVETPSPSPGGLRSPGSISSHHSRVPSLSRGIARFEARAEMDRHSLMPRSESRTRSRSIIGQESDVVPSVEAHSRTLHSAMTPRSASKTVRESTQMFTAASPPASLREATRNDSPMSGLTAPIPKGRESAAIVAHQRAREVTVPGATPRMPRLELDIPHGDMERYSVMFEKLLEPRQSILERRQSKARKQKGAMRKELPAIPSPDSVGPSPIDGLLDLGTTNLAQVGQLLTGPPGTARIQRSATTPHTLHRVPSLQISIDGTKQSEGLVRAQADGLNRPSIIKRSKTAPPGSVSPITTNFCRPTSRHRSVKAPKTFLAASSDDDEDPPTPVSLFAGENSLPPTPTTTYSTVADTDPVTISTSEHLPLPMFPKRPHKPQDSVDNQTWEMLTSAQSAALEPDSPVHGRHPHAFPRIKSPEDLERQIVQVSVARQVSVSKARRQVEKATTTKQPLRPRVVELNSKDKSRPKSTHVVLVQEGDLEAEAPPLPPLPMD